jgi:GT2 family glycosyltransferase
MPMHVAVAIVGFRNNDDIRNCLQALTSSTYRDVSIHICENGGEAAYRNLIAALDGLVVLEDAISAEGGSGAVIETRWGMLSGVGGIPIALHLASHNGGYAGGVNACLEQIKRGPAWHAMWVLNPDTEPDPGAIAALVAKADDGRYGAIGSRLVFKDSGRVQLYGGRWRRWMARGFNIGLNAPLDAQPDVAAVEREMTYVSGAALFATRPFIEAVGPMEEFYFLYNEEVDWCYRRGKFLLGYAHDSVVGHVHGSTMGSSSDKKRRSSLSVYLSARNSLVFTRRFFPRIYPLVVVTSLVLTLQYLQAAAFKNLCVALAGWWAALRGETGLPRWLRP